MKLKDIIPESVKDYIVAVCDGALGLGVILIIMIMVERAEGDSALGTFSYLLSLYMILGFLSGFGIPKYIESQVALKKIISTDNFLFINAFRTLLAASITCTMIIFLSAVYGTGITRVADGVAGYLIIGLIIPVRNLNDLKIAFLQGIGEQDAVFKLKLRKRIVLIVAIYFLLLISVPHLYLMMCFLFSELSITMEWKGFGNVFEKHHRKWDFKAALRHGRDYLFMDEALNVFLYLDFLILGVFVTSSDLGVYAQAAVLMRFFLLIPVSFKPIIRRFYCNNVSVTNDSMMSQLINRATAVLFFVHSVLALYFMLYYPDILHNLFISQGGENISFQIFSVFLPGLLFFSVVFGQESVYEAHGEIPSLQKIVVIVSSINLGLNLYLVPFAGFFGAAYATGISMFVYFILFGRSLSHVVKLDKKLYLLGGAGVYLIFVVFKRVDPGFIISLLLIPLTLFSLLCIMGFFKYSNKAM